MELYCDVKLGMERGEKMTGESGVSAGEMGDAFAGDTGEAFEENGERLAGDTGDTGLCPWTRSKKKAKRMTACFMGEWKGRNGIYYNEELCFRRGPMPPTPRSGEGPPWRQGSCCLGRWS